MQIANWLIARVPEYNTAAEHYATIAAEMIRDDLRDRMSQPAPQCAARPDRSRRRDEVVRMALVAIRSQGSEKVNDDLAARIHQDVRRIADMKDDLSRDAVVTLARELLDDPQLRPDVDLFLASRTAEVRDIEEQRLMAMVAKSIEYAPAITTSDRRIRRIR